MQEDIRTHTQWQRQDSLLLTPGTCTKEGLAMIVERPELKGGLPFIKERLKSTLTRHLSTDHHDLQSR